MDSGVSLVTADAFISGRSHGLPVCTSGVQLGGGNRPVLCGGVRGGFFRAAHVLVRAPLGSH